MFSYFEKNRDPILSRIEKYMKFDRDITILPIDFHKHWIHVLLHQKWYMVINILNGVVYPSYIAVFPLLVGFAVESGQFTLLMIIIGLLAGLRIVNLWMFRYHPIYVISAFQSIKVKAFEYLITVDPIYHSTRSSGQIISKINRGSQSMMALIEIILFSILSLVSGSIAVMIGLFSISTLAGIILSTTFIALVIVSGLLFRIRTILHYSVRTKSQDKATAINVESMQQAPFIRASFATEEQIEEMMNRNYYAMIQQAIGWRWAGYLLNPVQITFALVIMVITFILWNNDVDSGVMIGAILTLGALGRRLFEVGRTIDRFVVNIEDINDLFNFIRDFGTQTYPALTTDIHTEKK
jgi:ABC-type multidrug transport system fused ATPase/permease subunit